MKQLSDFEKSSNKHHETVQKTSVALAITTLEFIQALEKESFEGEINSISIDVKKLKEWYDIHKATDYFEAIKDSKTDMESVMIYNHHSFEFVDYNFKEKND